MLDAINSIIGQVNHILWDYLLIFLLIGTGLYFTLRLKFVQFVNFGEMFRLLGEGFTGKGRTHKNQVSSFQAFCIATASRVGTGNLAGVATAIAAGGPGAVFWMWIVALVGSASAFVESLLAQLFKERGGDSFIGGPAYYIRKGLNMPWMSTLFAVVICITFGLIFNAVQANTIAQAYDAAFGVSPYIMAAILAVSTLVIIFGGVQRIAKLVGVMVPVMAILYILLAIVIIAMNIGQVPGIIKSIFTSAFGVEQVFGGGVGAAISYGVKRGLFSNEAGMGSAPNAAATAAVSHPVKQGFIQALSVFTDTIIICTCTAVVVLLYGADVGYANMAGDGIQLTQNAVNQFIGAWGGPFIAICILLFAYSSIIGNYYYSEANIRYMTKNRAVLNGFRILVGVLVVWGAVAGLDIVWNFADLTMGVMAVINIVAILLLGKLALHLYHDYKSQKAEGKNPTFHAETLPDIDKKDIECW